MQENLNLSDGEDHVDPHRELEDCIRSTQVVPMIPRAQHVANLRSRLLEQAANGSRAPWTTSAADELATNKQGTVTWARNARRLSAVAAGFALAAGMLLALSFHLNTSGDLYAHTLAALAKTRTVHVTGWTSRIVRKWPLENPSPDVKQEKHAAEAWFWRGKDDSPMSYFRVGPVTQMTQGSESREYQADENLLCIFQSGVTKDELKRFESLSYFLSGLGESGAKQEDLGTRKEGGQTLRGIRVTHWGNTSELWMEAETNLPVRFHRATETDGRQVDLFDLKFSVNEVVPETILAYAPPKTDRVRYAGLHPSAELAWVERVRSISDRVVVNPPVGSVVILPREGQQTFYLQQRPMRTPEGAYWVVPLDLDQHSPLSIGDFLKLRVAAFADSLAWTLTTWRVPEELRDVQLKRADLVFATGTSPGVWAAHALNENGLEFADVQEQRTVWVAKYDGRKLAPWIDVVPPRKRRDRYVVVPGSGFRAADDAQARQAPMTMAGLFRDFNEVQAQDYSGSSPFIVDETGLPPVPVWNRKEFPRYEDFQEKVLEPKFFVAADSPYFQGEEGRVLAKEWYANHFGVTFEERQQTVTVHVVRRRP